MSTTEQFTDPIRPWGWSDARQAAYEQSGAELPPARVVAQHRGEFVLRAPWGKGIGVVPGRVRHRTTGPRMAPAVGDWVLVEPSPGGPATIQQILERTGVFVRRKAGTENAEQVVAANIDTAFLMSSLNLELNPRRIERYLVAARDSGATPVVVLTKGDLVEDPAPLVAAIEEVAAGAAVLVVSSIAEHGLDPLRGYLQPGKTVALLGSSGVGKSTLVNTLAGRELLRTRTVRELDDKGRHTTTHREIYLLDDGALVLDTPGMRELGLVDATEGLEESFDDLAALALDCRFRDCIHETEPACAIRAAVEAGTLSPERWESYSRLQRELNYEERRGDAFAAQAEKKRWKEIHKSLRKMPKKGG